MSPRTPGDAIKKFVAEINSTGILTKFAQILDLISGPITVAKDKINTIDTAGEIADFIPDIPPDFKLDLRRVILDSYEEEVGQAQSIIDELETAIGKIQSIAETFNQRLFEGYRTQNPLVINNRELVACHEDCRQILIYFKLKTKIIRHYLDTPFKEQSATVPLSNLKPYEATALELILRLKVINLPLS